MTPPPPGWCARLSADHPALARVFRAFGGTGPSACSADALASWSSRAKAGLAHRVVAVLSDEVDTDQAAMFARRLSAVGQLSTRIGQPALRLALMARATELLEAKGPRALRIRALADFYYSQAARLHHQAHTPARPLAEVVAAAAWTPVGTGLDWTQLTGPGPAGPLHINVLRGHHPTVRCVHLPGGHPSLPDVVREHGAAAGVSGGFFLYSEPDIPAPLARRDPVGLLLTDGQVVAGPWFRRATLVVKGDGLVVDRVGPVGFTVSAGGHTVRIEACNDPAATGPTLFNRAFGTRAPRTGLRIRGSQARGHGDDIDLLGGVVTGLPDVRGPVTWRAPAGWRQAMAGGPMLLGDGPTLDLVHEDFAEDAPPITFSRDETYDENLLPRMAAGLDADGRLVFAAIDGRNFDRAPGFTLRMTADLMRALGCVRAMNLDGGSSKRMAVDGRCVDLASTEVVSTGSGPAPVRKVVTAILVGEGQSV